MSPVHRPQPPDCDGQAHTWFWSLPGPLTSGPRLLRPPTQCLPPWGSAGMWGPECPLEGLSRTKTRPPGPAPHICPHLCLKPKLRSWAWVFRRWWLWVPCIQAREGTGGGLGLSGKEGQLDPTFGRGPLTLQPTPHFSPLPPFTDVFYFFFFNDKVLKTKSH